MEPALDALIERPLVPADQELAQFSIGPEDEADLAAALERVAAHAGALAGKPQEVALRWAMGRVMPTFVGRVAPQRVREMLIDRLTKSTERTEG